MKYNFSFVNSKLMSRGYNYCLSPYKIRDYNKNNYRRLSRNR